MGIDREIRALRHGMKKYGADVRVIIDKQVYHTKAMTQDSRKTFHVRYNDNLKVEPLGERRDKDKVLFIACDSGVLWHAWHNTENAIFVRLNNIMYEVLADSDMSVGGDPLYLWALCRPVDKLIEGYYDDIG